MGAESDAQVRTTRPERIRPDAPARTPAGGSCVVRDGTARRWRKPWRSPASTRERRTNRRHQEVLRGRRRADISFRPALCTTARTPDDLLRRCNRTRPGSAVPDLSVFHVEHRSHQASSSRPAKGPPSLSHEFNSRAGSPGPTRCASGADPLRSRATARWRRPEQGYGCPSTPPADRPYQFHLRGCAAGGCCSHPGRGGAPGCGRAAGRRACDDMARWARQAEPGGPTPSPTPPDLAPPPIAAEGHTPTWDSRPPKLPLASSGPRHGVTSTRVSCEPLERDAVGLGAASDRPAPPPCATRP
jgi:hypothetical protein